MPPDEPRNARDMSPEEYRAARAKLIADERRNGSRADAARDLAAAQRRHPDLAKHAKKEG